MAARDPDREDNGAVGDDDRSAGRRDPPGPATVARVEKGAKSWRGGSGDAKATLTEASSRHKPEAAERAHAEGGKRSTAPGEDHSRAAARPCARRARRQALCPPEIPRPRLRHACDRLRACAGGLVVGGGVNFHSNTSFPFFQRCQTINTGINTVFKGFKITIVGIFDFSRIITSI